MLRNRWIPIFIICSLLLCACGHPAAPDDDGALKVVTSFFPIMLIADAVIGDVEDVSLSNLTQPQTGCLHDYTLLPQDMKTLEQADVFVINGLGMESFIDKVTSTLPDLKVVDLSAGITPIDNNPHIWLSPDNAKQMAETLRDALSDITPANTARYTQNTASFTNGLALLDEEMHQMLADVPNRDIVTFHESVAYLAQEFGLNIRAVIQREPGEEPSTKELAETVDVVKATGVTALFTEPQYAPTAAKTISAETGASVYQLDPLVTGDNDETYEAYFSRMRENAKTLAKALSN